MDRQSDKAAESEIELLRLLAHTLTQHAVFAIDRQGRVETWSEPAARLLGYRAEEIVGRPADLLLAPGPETNAAGEDTVVRSSAGFFAAAAHQAMLQAPWRHGCVLLPQGGLPFAAHVRVLPLAGSEGQPLQLAVVVEKQAPVVPPLVSAEANGSSSTSQGEAVPSEKIQERRRAAQVGVTNALAHSADADEAAPRILQAICDNLGWDVGVFWVVDDTIGQLRSRAFWHLPGSDVEAFEQFSRERTVGLGEGWPGRIWETAQPAFVADGAHKKNFPRLKAACDVGLHGAFGIPLMLGNEVLGVAEFYSRQIRQPDADLLDMMITMGGHIGQFLQRTRNEQRLRESEQRFRGLMEQAPFSIQIFSSDGYTVQVNRAWEQLWGLKPEQVRDYNILQDEQLADHGAIQAIYSAFRGEAAEVPPVEYDPNIAVPAGSKLDHPRWVSSVAYPLRGANGEVREVILVHQDITSQKQAERMLRDSEERFRGIVNHSIAGVAEVDLEGRFLFANARYCEIVGRPWEELRNLAIADVTHRDDLDRNLSQFHEIIKDGVPYVIEKRYVLPDGNVVWVNNSVSALHDTDGQVKSVVAVCVDITDRRRAEEAVREGEERLRTLIDNLPHGAVYRSLYSHESDTIRFTFLSAGVEPIFGVTAEEGVANSDLIYDLIHPDDRERLRTEEAAAIKNCSQFDSEFRIVQKSGEVRWLHCRSAPHRFPKGELVWEGVMLDITDRKKTESTLRVQEDRLRVALEAGRMGAWNWDTRTNEVHWSTQLEAIHGLEPGTFPGTFEAFQSDMHPDDRERVFASVQNAMTTGAEHHVEYRIVLPDGTTRWVEARGRLFSDDDEQPLQMIGVCMEVTERKRKEEDLRFLAMASRSLATLTDHEAMLQRIVGLAVPHFADWCAIYLPDENGSKLRLLAAVHVNPKKAEMVRELHRRWPPDPDTPHGIYHVFRTGEPSLVEEIHESMLRAAAKDDAHFEFLRQLGMTSYMAVPLAIRDQMIGVMMFISAETGRHYTPQDLALAEDLGRRAAIASENARLYAKLQEEGQKKDEFLAMLAHELRNPLAPIRCGLDLLALSGTDPEILGTMKQQVEHLVRLVDDLLDVSRIMRGKVDLRQEAVELKGVVARAVDTVRPLIETHRQTLDVQVPEKQVWLSADPVRLAQVIGNLLNNASKYTEPGGHIRLSTKSQAGQVQVTIEDNGIGIHPELLPHVFDLFSQDQRTIDRAQGGLGIGLTVVKSLVELHGGMVRVESEGPGHGSRFTVELPTIAPPERHPDGHALESPSPPLRILVVDDNLSAAKMLGLLLKKLGGHEILMAHDGLAALEAAKEHRPDLILLDIGLPKLDGFEVGRRLRQHPEFHQIRMVALTGYGTEEDRRKTQAAGFDDHLVKPPGVEMLQKLLATVTPRRH